MKIALVYRHFNERGSIERQHVGLARYLVARDHEVHVFSIRATSEPELVPEAIFHAVPVSGLGSPWSARELFSYARNVERMLASLEFDCVHGRIPSSSAHIVHVPGVAAARQDGVSRLRYAASLVRHPPELARLVAEVRAVRSRSARLFHVDSPRVKEDLKRCYRIDPVRIAVVPHAVDVELFHPVTDKASLRRMLGLPEDETILLFCGHDFMRKGLDRAIDALAGMNDPARLVVVGKRDRTLFEARAARLGVSSRVHFVGERSDPHLFHQAADILVLPSRFELWGIPVIEAMAAGVPPVVAGAVGAAEAVSAAQAGLVLNEPFSAPELASALDRLAGSPALRHELGERGTRAASAYSWEAIGARVLSDIVTVAGEIPSASS